MRYETPEFVGFPMSVDPLAIFISDFGLKVVSYFGLHVTLFSVINKRGP